MYYKVTLEEEKANVIDYIKSNKVEMLNKGLESVYISGYEYNCNEIMISVIYVCTEVSDYNYWASIREMTRLSGATYVSNYLSGNKRIIDILSLDFDKIQL